MRSGRMNKVEGEGVNDCGDPGDGCRAEGMEGAELVFLAILQMTFLPWFGSICALELVARLGHKDKNGGGGGTPLVLVLNEGGQLIVHDIGVSLMAPKGKGSRERGSR